jgi:hypothetical protein
MWLSPSPVLPDPLHVQIPQVLSLCYAIPTSLPRYQNSGLVCFLILLPATIFPPLMLRPTQGQRASSWPRGLYFHTIITCKAICHLFLKPSGLPCWSPPPQTHSMHWHSVSGLQTQPVRGTSFWPWHRDGKFTSHLLIKGVKNLVWGTLMGNGY